MAVWKKSVQGPTDAAGAFTVIKRVVPTAGGFFCGICRAIHATWTSAKTCVESCWTAQLQAQPTVAIRKGRFTLHRCRFCKREHADFMDAANCAAQCSENLIAQANRSTSEIEQERVDLNISYVTPKKFSYTIDASTTSPIAMQEMVKTVLMPFQVRNALLSQKAMKPLLQAMLKHASAIAIGKRPIGGANFQGANNMAHDAPNKPQSGTASAKKDPAKKFFRDGAKYVCAVCRGKFFTKIEVESCWEKH